MVLLAYFVAAYLKSYIFELPLDIDNDLKNIKHPVVGNVSKHIKYFKATDEDYFNTLKKETQIRSKLSKPKNAPLLQLMKNTEIY